MCWRTGAERGEVRTLAGCWNRSAVPLICNTFLNRS